MNYNTKSLREVAYPKPLRECGIEELAVHQITAKPSGGILFARKQTDTEKDRARNAVLRLFSRKQFPKGLSILTMPGLHWRFERELLDRREGSWMSKNGPKRTYFTCIENDRSIYHSALTKMPGIQQLRHDRSTIQVLPPTAFSERNIRNTWIGRYFFGNVDDLMVAQPVPFDAAWLDYTGPLTVKRLRIISAFFRKNIRHILVVTSLKARWNRDTVRAIEQAGGHSAWVRSELCGSLLHDIEYQDGAPMSQIAIRKT